MAACRGCGLNRQLGYLNTSRQLLQLACRTRHVASISKVSRHLTFDTRIMFFLRNDAGNSHLNIRQTALPRRFAATRTGRTTRATVPATARRTSDAPAATWSGEFGEIRAEIGLPFRRHGFQTFRRCDRQYRA